MVNANVIISVSAVVIASIVGIVVWMKMRGATPDTMSLADACAGYFGADGVLPEGASVEGGLNSCDAIKANGWTWDTPIPCTTESDYFYTMRGVFAATDSMLAKVKALSSTAVGGPVPANFQITDVTDYISAQCHTGSNRKLMTPEQRALGLASMVNYGPCSINLALSFLGGAWASDNAECSGNPHSQGNCHGVSARTSVGARQQIANMFDRNNNNWLYAGCYNHDICLQKGGNGNDATPYGNMGCNTNPVYDTASWATGVNHLSSGTDCDGALTTAAYNCLTTWWWQNCLCSWAGCASCPYQPCPNSNIMSTAVYAAIGSGPNRAFCTTA